MKYMMDDKDRKRLIVIRGSLDGKLTVREAAARLGLGGREVKKLRKKVRERGDAAIIHGNSGRHPANYTDEELRKRIADLKRENKAYEIASFAYFRELLETNEHIQISYKALGGILKAAGIFPTRKHRASGEKYLRRERREEEGELLQTDASPYDWFGTGTREALHGFIDDASGKITGLYMCLNECLQGYLEALRQVLLNYGLPVAIYADRSGVFFVNTKKKENWSLEEQLAGHPLDKTQFGLIADKLGIDLIPAGSPQAKGRIERLWQTLQGRLPVWFRLHHINDMASANAALPDFITEFNERFAVKPKSDKSAFEKLDKSFDLDTLLAVRYERKTDACSCFSFKNHTFQVESEKPIVRKKIVFLFSEKIGFKVYYEHAYYPVKYLEYLHEDGAEDLPKVTNLLVNLCYYEDAKKNYRYLPRG
jgi:transposase